MLANWRTAHSTAHVASQSVEIAQVTAGPTPVLLIQVKELPFAAKRVALAAQALGSTRRLPRSGASGSF
jgi:hypothetical protein